MKELFGSPGRVSGLGLRVGQFAFAAASIGVMVSARGFFNSTAFWLHLFYHLQVHVHQLELQFCTRKTCITAKDHHFSHAAGSKSLLLWHLSHGSSLPFLLMSCFGFWPMYESFNINHSAIFFILPCKYRYIRNPSVFPGNARIFPFQ
uniref:CASP-like protein n=1 Tax=Manihot esculenta TaxID=3983 RepID=A0A2C9V2N6_MANES